MKLQGALLMLEESVLQEMVKVQDEVVFCGWPLATNELLQLGGFGSAFWKFDCGPARSFFLTRAQTF